MKFYLFLSLLITCTLIQCATEPQVDAASVNEEIQPYIDSFVSEAEDRDLIIEIDSETFSAQIAFILDRGTVGQCRVYSDGSQEVVIHSPYWNSINDLDREYLVFHELGHCILGRDHNDESDNQGNCISIMQNGDDTCDKLYRPQNRSELLDELFN